MSKKIAILGLAANPIHIGHIAVATYVADFLVDEVWISPCYSHMHNKEMVDPQHRLAMCRLAVDSDLQFDVDSSTRHKIKVSSIEIEEKWQLSTYEALSRLKKTMPEVDFYFIIGQDNADNIHKWKYSEQLLKEFTFIVLSRDQESKNIENQWYLNPPHLFISNFKIPISSTDIRHSLEGNKFYLPPKVYDYIIEHKLYGAK